MAKKHKKVTKVSKPVTSKRTVSKQTSSPFAFLFRRYESPVAFTVIVSCFAFAFFMVVNMALTTTSNLIAKQEAQITAMNHMGSMMGSVAGVMDEAKE